MTLPVPVTFPIRAWTDRTYPVKDIWAIMRPGTASSDDGTPCPYSQDVTR